MMLALVAGAVFGLSPAPSIATGTFEVTLTPAAGETVDGVTLGRMAFTKTFAGDLSGTSSGEMLTVITPTDGSATYVAVERVTATLGSAKGSFALHHRGIMHEGTQALLIEVAPASGTGALMGLAGQMSINVEDDGTHRYRFKYTLQE